MAFDEVWHLGILHKIIEMKIPDILIHWVHSFLTRRLFTVKIAEAQSSTGNISCGCPQGAIISPLLFNIYINDIPIARKPHRSFSLIFADDLATSFQFKSPKKFIAAAKKYLLDIENWTKKWRLEMNTTKSNFTIFTKNKKRKKNYKFQIFGSPLSHNPNPKFLGIVFEEYLCFNEQTKCIRQKCISRLNLIKIFSHKSWKLSKKPLSVSVSNKLNQATIHSSAHSS